ncbi:MAG: NADH-quinone oxidoreductase subunit M, partial [Gemmatimonadota bacterium]
MASFLASIGYEHWVIHVLLGLPILAMPVILFAPVRAARYIAFGVALTELVVGIGLWWAYDPSRSGMQFVTDVTWVPGFGIGYRVGIDGLSVLMVLLSVIMLPLVVWSSWRGIDQKQRGFYALIMALNTGMLGVFVSTDLFLFYMFWEMLLI